MQYVIRHPAAAGPHHVSDNGDNQDPKLNGRSVGDRPVFRFSDLDGYDVAAVGKKGLAGRIGSAIAYGLDDLAKRCERVHSTQQGNRDFTRQNTIGESTVNHYEWPLVRLMWMLLIISNFILCSVLIVVFVVPSSAVITEVKKQAVIIEDVSRQLTQLVEVVEHDKSIAFDENEFKEWRTRAQELNPNINLPTLEDVMR